MEEVVKSAMVDLFDNLDVLYGSSVALQIRDLVNITIADRHLELATLLVQHGCIDAMDQVSVRAWMQMMNLNLKQILKDVNSINVMPSHTWDTYDAMVTIWGYRSVRGMAAAIERAEIAGADTCVLMKTHVVQHLASL